MTTTYGRVKTDTHKQSGHWVWQQYILTPITFNTLLFPPVWRSDHFLQTCGSGHKTGIDFTTKAPSGHV